MLQKIVLALPFAAVYSTPLLIYLGNDPAERLRAAFAAQLAWFVAFAVLAVVWRAAQRRVVVQGG